MGNTHTSVSHPRPRALWRNVSFTLMWSSVAASGFGDRMIMLAAFALLGVHLVEADASSIQAAVTFFFFLPYLILGPVGGWLADTLPRKWIMFSCDEMRALLLLWAVVLVPSGIEAALPPDHQWKVLAVIGAVGCFAAVFSPTRNATVPQIVPVHQLQSANAVVMAIAVIASMIGMYVGGMIIDENDAGSVKIGLIVGTLLYGISGWFFPFMRVRPHAAIIHGEARRGQLHRLIDAAGYVRRHRSLLVLIVLSMIFWTSANVVVAAIATLSKIRFADEGPFILTFSRLSVSIGLGMLCSSMVLSLLGNRRESSWLGVLCLLLGGLSMAMLTVVFNFTLAVALCFCAGFFGNAANVMFATLTQIITADYIRGRVFGLRELLTTGSAVAINFIIWQTPGADSLMIPTLAVSAGLVMLLAVAVFVVEIRRGPHPRAMANILWRVNRLLVLIWHGIEWRGKHHVPATGPVILAANHTTALDPFLIQAPVRRMVRWLMLRNHLFWWAWPLWRINRPIALEKSGSDVARLRQIIQALKEGDIVGLFPEGRLQRDRRELAPFEAGIGLIAQRGDAVIVPVWIDGTPRKRHMLWHFLCPSRSRVTFGQPFKPDRDMSHQQIADELRRRMLELSEGE